MPKMCSTYTKYCISLIKSLQSNMEHECSKGYCPVLELSLNSSCEEINRAFRQQTLRHHPDFFLGSPSRQKEEELFRKIVECRRYLISLLQGINNSGILDSSKNELVPKSPGIYIQEL